MDPGGNPKVTSPIDILRRRHRGFIALVWFSLTAGFAAVFAALSFVRLDSIWPFRTSPLVRPVAVPDTTWRTPWTDSAVTVAETQTASLRALVDILIVLALAAAAMALINVIALLAARRTARRADQAVRAALGCPPRQFLRDRLTEDAFLHGGGLALAIVAGAGLIFALRGVWPPGLEPPAQPGMAVSAMLLAALAMALGLLAMRAGCRAPPMRDALLGGRATAGPAAGREQAAPAVIQLALALALASTAALLLRHGRSETGQAGAAEGTAGYVAMELRASQPDPRARAALYSGLLERMSDWVGVEAESLASPGAWLGLGVLDNVMVECGACARGGMYMPIQPAVVAHHAVSPGFFEAMGIPVIAGREFDASDTYDSARVAVVNETFARARFDRQGPIGRGVQLRGTGGEWYTVVGIVRDVPARGIGAPRVPLPAVYLATTQEPPSVVGLAARTPQDPAGVAARVEADLRASPAAGPPGGAAARVVDPGMLDERRDRAVAPLRWFALLFAVLGGAAATLAVHGVFSLVRASIRARRRELAVRSAIGASPTRLLGLVLGRTGRTAAVGLVLGGVAAWTAGRALQLYMGGVPPIDLDDALRLAGLLGVAALLGALPGARQAMRVPPAVALRED